MNFFIWFFINLASGTFLVRVFAQKLYASLKVPRLKHYSVIKERRMYGHPFGKGKGSFI